MRRLVLLLICGWLLLAAAWYAMAKAHAGVDGTVPSPGNCDYPAICKFGMIGEGVVAEYYWYSDEPTEENGSHRHCEYGGAASTFNGNFSAFMFTAGVSAPVGALVGSCDYRCPNNAMAKEPMPNPPSMWLQGYGYNGTKCTSVGDPLPLPNIPLPPGVTPPAASAGPAGPVPEVR